MRMRLWSRVSDDEGFTLLELTVAMMIIAVVIVTLVGLQVSSLKTVAVAKQRQQATAIADQKIERLRAAPYATIQAGLLSTDPTLNATADPRISGTRLGAPWNEALVLSSNQPEPELDPHKQVLPATQYNGVTYTVYTYITHPLNADGSDSNSSIDFWLTVVVQWSSPSTHNQLKTVTERTRLAYPAGCKGSATHPYAGPCQPFLYGNAGRTNGGITIVPASSSAPALAGLSFNSAAEVFPNYTSQIGIEQTTSTLAKAVTAGTNVDGAATGQSTTSSAADIDPSTSTAGGPYNVSLPSASSATNTLTGSNGVLSLLQPGFAAGGALQTAVASTAAGNCQDLLGNVTATGQACAASQVPATGSNEADLDLSNIAGRDLPPMVLAGMQPASTASRSFEARFLAGFNNHCTGTSGDGCVAAGASRTITSFVAGGLPASQAGDTVPSGFSGLVTGTNYTDSASAEAGVNSAAANTSPQFAATRSGTVNYWNGSSYQSVNLSTTQTYTLGAVNAVYLSNGSPTITIAMSGTLKVTAPTVTKTTPANCQPTACTSKTDTGSLVATVTYQITGNSGQLAYFTVTLDLGTLQATATYRAVP